MPNKKYIHRSIEREIKGRANEFPIIVLTGPRQTGKSTLLKKIFPNHHYVSLDKPLTKKQALDDPETFLENNPSPLIIDEIQYAPSLLPYIKTLVDNKRHLNGSFILTGSQVFALMQGISESLAGRIAIFELLGFSLEEINPHKKSFNVQGCFNLIYQGSFPEVCVHHANLNSFFSSYLQTYLERDIRQIKAIHDLNVFQDFLELLAARTGNLLNLNEISKECGVSTTNIRNWISILETCRMVYLLRSYSKNITKRVIKSPKIYFTDTGLLSYILRYPSSSTLLQGAPSGAFFENMIILEILKYKFNYNKRFELYFYRDSNQNEADVVIDFGYKRTLIEIKKTKTLRQGHWKSLKKISETLNTQEIYLISNYPQEMILDSDIKHLPWWHINKILE